MTAEYNMQQGVRRPRIFKVVVVIMVIVLLLVVVGAGGAYHWYQQNLEPVSSLEKANKVVVVQNGWNAAQIAEQLHEQELIRNPKVFGWYVDRAGVRQSLQAGTYEISPDMSVPEIVDKIVAGDVSTQLFTILPGKRLDEIREAFIAANFTESAIDEAFNPALYNTPLLDSLPEGADLEGYLFPETYQITIDASPAQIVEQALSQMSRVIDASVLDGIAQQDMTLHEAVILASVVEKESGDVADRKKIAQVFLKRLAIGMELGADATFVYAAALSGEPATPSLDSPYNTRIYPGLPPGPISNVSATSIEAISNPANTDYLYFVSGDDGITRFSSTLAEHERLTAEYCIELCRVPQ